MLLTTCPGFVPDFGTAYLGPTYFLTIAMDGRSGVVYTNDRD